MKLRQIDNKNFQFFIRLSQVRPHVPHVVKKRPGSPESSVKAQKDFTATDVKTVENNIQTAKIYTNYGIKNRSTSVLPPSQQHYSNPQSMPDIPSENSRAQSRGSNKIASTAREVQSSS